MIAPRRRTPSLFDSFNYAVEGIVHVLRTQRNMRIHFLAAIAVLVLALVADVSRLELIALLLAIAFVLIAEMVNTAIEAAVDVASTSFDPMAKLAKDIGAGAVLIAAVNAVAVGYLVFSGTVAEKSSNLLDRLYNLEDLRKFDLADRRQQVLKARLNVMPAAELDIGLSLLARTNTYPAEFGRSGVQSQRVLNLDVGYLPTTTTAVHGHYSQQRSRMRQGSVAELGGPVEAGCASLPPSCSNVFAAPRSIDALAELRAARPEARLLAGSTDIGLWVNKQFKALPELIYLGEAAGLARIEQRADGVLSIGAAASLEDAWSALAARHPELNEMWLRFSSLPVRNAGTMGGNVANGSPIGDSAPVLIALNATLVLRHGKSQRRLPLEAFYLDYMKNALQAGEFVEAIEVPPPAHTALRAYKLSKRFDCDISALAAALAITLDGDTVREARFAFGGMAAIVKRAAKAEGAVRGQPWNEATAEAAAAALNEDFTPLTDLRASAAYRQRAAGNLLRRFWLETRTEAPLSAAQTTVWAREVVTP